MTFARLHVIPHLPQFLDTHPDLTIDVVLDDRMIDLVEEGMDVALRMGSLGGSSSLTTASERPRISPDPAFQQHQPNSSSMRP